MIKNFRDLNVYQRAKNLAKEIYRLTQTFPQFERYELGSQARRAVTSICLNIAEGNSQVYTAKEINHLNIALGSAAELRAILDLILQLGYIDEAQFQKVDREVEEMQKMLYSMIKRLRVKDANGV
jgi:four helix bundle protein